MPQGNFEDFEKALYTHRGVRGLPNTPDRRLCATHVEGMASKTGEHSVPLLDFSPVSVYTPQREKGKINRTRKYMRLQKTHKRKHA